MDGPQAMDNGTKLEPKMNKCFVYPLSTNFFETVCVICLLGFLLNVVLLARIIKDRKLHCTTFAVIGELAVSDIVYIVTYASKSTFARFLPCVPLREYRLAMIFLECGMMGAWFSSSLHTVLIAVVRFIILCYPIRSRVWLTTRRLIVTSVCIWIFSLANGSTVFLYRDYLFVFICCCYVISVLLITVFHVLKLYNLQKIRVIQVSNVKREKTNMSRMVTVVILVFVVFPLPFIAGSIAKYLGLHKNPLYVDIGSTLLTLNSAINPIIYGFLSVVFRQSVLRMLHCTNSELSKNNSPRSSAVQYSKKNNQ